MDTTITATDSKTYLTPASENLGLFMQRGITGPLTMVNLMRFRDQADYSLTPEAAPSEAISGRSAFGLYLEAIQQPLADVGGNVIMHADAGNFLIGPIDEHWDNMLIIGFPMPAAFVGFTSSPAYLAASAHRTAALVDSRLLPTEEVFA